MGVNRNNHLKGLNDITVSMIDEVTDDPDLHYNILRINFPIKKIISGPESTLFISKDNKYYALGKNNFLDIINREQFDILTEIRFPFIIKSGLFRGQPTGRGFGFFFLDTEGQVYFNGVHILQNYKILKIIEGFHLIYGQINNNKFILINYTANNGQFFIEKQITDIDGSTEIIVPDNKKIEKSHILSIYNPKRRSSHLIIIFTEDHQIYLYYTAYKSWIHFTFNFVIKKVYFKYSELIFISENNDKYMINDRKYISVEKDKRKIDFKQFVIFKVSEITTDNIGFTWSEERARKADASGYFIRIYKKHSQSRNYFEIKRNWAFGHNRTDKKILNIDDVYIPSIPIPIKYSESDENFTIIEYPVRIVGSYYDLLEWYNDYFVPFLQKNGISMPSFDDFIMQYGFYAINVLGQEYYDSVNKITEGRQLRVIDEKISTILNAQIKARKERPNDPTTYTPYIRAFELYMSDRNKRDLRGKERVRTSPEGIFSIPIDIEDSMEMQLKEGKSGVYNINIDNLNKLNIDGNIEQIYTTKKGNLLYITDKENSVFRDGKGIKYEEPTKFRREYNPELVRLLNHPVNRMFVFKFLTYGFFGISGGEIEVNYDTYLKVTIDSFVFKQDLAVHYLGMYKDVIKLIDFNQVKDIEPTEHYYPIVRYFNSKFPQYTFIVRIKYENGIISPLV